MANKLYHIIKVYDRCYPFEPVLESARIPDEDFNLIVRSDNMLMNNFPADKYVVRIEGWIE